MYPYLLQLGVFWIGATWSHLQGLVSVWAIALKPDIRIAFIGTVTCGLYTPSDEVQNNRCGCCSRNGRHSFFRSLTWDADRNTGNGSDTIRQLSNEHKVGDREKQTSATESNLSSNRSSGMIRQAPLPFTSINELLGGSQMMSIVETAEEVLGHESVLDVMKESGVNINSGCSKVSESEDEMKDEPFEDNERSTSKVVDRV